MRDLLYKEFKLSINRGFFAFPLFGILLLIPHWPYFIALMYVLFIAVPNIFTANKANNDIGFSVMLPVRKRDVVKARLVSILVLEILQIVTAVIFAAINISMYKGNNAMLEPNVAFFGLAFVLYSIFNLVFFPMFYKTGYKSGAPTIIAIAAALIFMVSVEILELFVPSVNIYINSVVNMVNQLPILFIGMVLFVLSAIAAYKLSAKRFEKIDV